MGFDCCVARPEMVLDQFQLVFALDLSDQPDLCSFQLMEPHPTKVIRKMTGEFQC